MMGKPENSVYESFIKKYKQTNAKLGKEQYVVPYLMSSHPGSTIKEAVKLAEYLRDLGYMPEQVQDFYPTPSTISTCMYYTGLDPRTMKEVYTPKSPHEKAMQRALIQYRNPKNYDLVLEALKLAGREDLIGYEKRCLIRPKEGRGYGAPNFGGGNYGRSGEGKNISKSSSGRTTGKNGNSASASGKSSKGGSSKAGAFGKHAADAKKAEAPKKKKTIRNVHKKK